MDINLDLRFEGQLDLRIQGFIGLDGNGARERYRIQNSPRRLEALPAAEGDSGVENDATQRPSTARRQQEIGQQRTSRRAVMKTREAITALKDAVKTEDTQRLRQATAHLREAAISLRDAVHRRGAATATDEEQPSGASDVVDAEL
jgi:hypothetical protein